MSGGEETRIVIRTDLDRRGLRDLTQELNHAERETEQTDHAMDDLGNAARRAGREASDAMEDAAQSTDDASESAGGLHDALGAVGERGSGFLDGLTEHAGIAGEALGKLGPYGKAAAVAIGVAMAGAAAAVHLLTEGIKGSIERSADLGRMKAQLLLSPEDAQKYAKSAAKVYTDNWGESIEEASSYVRDAALYIMPSPAVMNAKIAPTVEAVAEKIAALATTMDEDGKMVASAIQHMLVTGMAKSADEAFNLLHAGIAKGVNSADDLLDTFIEYSTQFRQLGLNGQQAMGLLSQGLQHGARDADTVADGLKEIAILAQEVGNDTVSGAFQKLGLNQKKLATDFAAGGERASAALALVLDKLRAIKDPMQQNAMATALFGTKAEDLQDALFGLDLHTAAQGLGDIAGAADLAASHMSGNAYSAIEAYQRKWEMFKADLGDKFIPIFEKVLTAVEKFATEAGPVVIQMVDNIKKAFADNKDELKQFGEILGIVFGVGAQAAIGAIYLGVMAVIKVASVLGDTWEHTKLGFALFVSFGLWGWGLLLKAAEAAFGWMPGIGPKLKEAEKEFSAFAADVNADLAKILDKTVHVNVQVSQSGYAPVTAGGALSPSTHRFMASGGTGSGVIVAGEHGPELIDLGSSGRVYNENQTRRMVTGVAGGGGGGSTIVVQPVADDGGDSFAIAWFNDALARGRLRWKVGSGGRIQPA